MSGVDLLIFGNEHQPAEDIPALARAQSLRHAIERHRSRHDGLQGPVLVQYEDAAVRGVDDRAIVPGARRPVHAQHGIDVVELVEALLARGMDEDR
ncbi:MAG: hypothetical protein U1E60_25415 [Reyranellaceae bacterium]